MPFDLEGPTRIRNVKFDVFIGRPPIEDSSLLPKSFIPSKVNKSERTLYFITIQAIIQSNGNSTAPRLSWGKPTMFPAYDRQPSWEVMTRDTIGRLIIQLGLCAFCYYAPFPKAYLNIEASGTWTPRKCGRSRAAQTNPKLYTYVFLRSTH